MDCSIVPSRHAGYMTISTTDFFYPLVDDPYEQGIIACANVLSDMYACGVVDIDNVLMTLAASNKMDPSTRKIVTRKMIEGFVAAAEKAGTAVTGGQTVIGPWPIIGGVAMSFVGRSEYIDPSGGKAGDVIVLTKPLGTQIAVNLNEWIGNPARWSVVQDVITEDEALEMYDKARESMRRLNRNAAGLMHKHGAHGATDVTGFGILGHAANLAEHQDERVDIELQVLPLLAGSARVNEKFNFKLTQGYSAETSGGLLVMLPSETADAFIADLSEADGADAWIVGRVIAGSKTARLADDVRIVEV